MLLHRQNRGHSVTSTRSWLICSGHLCPEAGGLRARRPLAGTGLRREGLAAQSEVPASEGSGSRVKDGGTETLPPSLTCLLISPLAGYRGDQISKQSRCLHPPPVIANRETALGIVPWDFLFSLMVSAVLDVRSPVDRAPWCLPQRECCLVFAGVSPGRAPCPQQQALQHCVQQWALGPAWPQPVSRASNPRPSPPIHLSHLSCLLTSARQPGSGCRPISPPVSVADGRADT